MLNIQTVEFEDIKIGCKFSINNFRNMRCYGPFTKTSESSFERSDGRRYNVRDTGIWAQIYRDSDNGQCLFKEEPCANSKTT